jgi:hypothetical protein
MERFTSASRPDQMYVNKKNAEQRISNYTSILNY